MKTLLVVDGNSIINRAFYGVKTALSTRTGLPTNALFGFVNILTRITEEYRPDKAVAAFDVHAPTFRHKMFDGYKANRRPMPEELREQMPYAPRVCRALGFSCFSQEGFEADDILGTFSAIGEKNGYRTLLLTGDRDSLQLIGDSTSVILAAGGEYPLYDKARFFEEYGILPEQFVDLKAIMGDSSDCYPGVRGIGEKGALELMKQFGSLDAVYDGYLLPENGIKKGTAAKLAEGRESAYLSRELATICRSMNLPAPEELPDCVPDAAEARRLFTELEFGQFLRKFALDTAEPAPAPGAVFARRDSLAGLLTPGAAVSCDHGFVYLYNGTDAVCVPETSAVLTELAAAASGLCVHDAKTFCRSAERLGVHLRGFGFDVMLAAYILDPQAKNGVPELVTAYLGDAVSASVPDAWYVYALRPVLEEKMKAIGGERLFSEIEMPLCDVLADMERDGFLVDLDALGKYGSVLSGQVQALTHAIYFECGCEFNINSPKQLGEVLFEKMGLPYEGKKKGQYSTAADVLEKLAPYSPAVADILEYRKLTKLIGTYIQGLSSLADADGTVHTSFRQTGTATGRLSSAEPNLQNIPVRTEEGRALRSCFTARPGHILIDADYSQIELRLLAAISGDEAMLEAFASGQDIHASTAARVFRVPLSDVTPELRKKAKAVNFGIVYGIGAYSLSQDLGVSQAQAKRYIDDYKAGFPGVSAYLDAVIAQARQDGYVTTLFGRRRYIPEINAKNGVIRKFGERVAMNSPIQGTAADIIKIAMIRVAERLREEQLDARLILQVHDELILDAAPECAGRARAILQECMESAAELPVRLSVEITEGERWEG